MPDKIDLVTFAIPTYNRAAFIEELLAYMFDELELFEYPIMIADNCSSDNTQEIVECYKSKYPNIIYHRHEKNIGADLNALFIQDTFTTKYLWMIGDAVHVYKKQLNEVLDIISKNDYDALIMNYFSRVHIESRIYTDRNELLRDLGWHSTQYSAVITSKDVFKKDFSISLSEESFFSFYYRFFDYLGQKEQIKVYWYAPNSLSFSTIQKTNSWHSRVVPIWIKNFTETVMALPFAYSLNSKLYCLKSYGKSHNLFRIDSVIYYTIKGFYQPSDIVKYRAHFKLIMPLNWRIYYLIFHAPKIVLKAGINLYASLAKCRRKLINFVSNKRLVSDGN